MHHEPAVIQLSDYRKEFTKKKPAVEKEPVNQWPTKKTKKKTKNKITTIMENVAKL